MKTLKPKVHTLPEERPFVPEPGRGKPEYISQKRSSIYGELRGGASRGKSRGGGSKLSHFGKGISRGPGGKYRQRVTVKARFQKHKGKAAAKALRRHVSYLSREGVDRDGGPAKLFDQDSSLEKEAVLHKVESWAGDRHHWRLVISPERGGDLDLNHFAQEFIGGLEKDLGTKLEWLGAAHYNTENPHIHLLIRGKTDRGQDLVIKRSYVSFGMRDLAEELATKTLGHRKDWEIHQSLLRSVTQERVGEIDRNLLAEARQSVDGVIDLRTPRNNANKAIKDLKIRRLKFLKERGLSRRIQSGQWQLSKHMEKVLHDLAIQGDIIKTMHANMRPGIENIVFQPGVHGDLTGTVVHKGFSDPLNDKVFMLVEGSDDRNYYVKLSRYSERDGAESDVGDLVKISSAGFGERDIDRVILKVAENNEGIVTSDSALQYLRHREKSTDRRSPETHLKNLARRLSALERRRIVTREDEASWRVPHDLRERVREKLDLHAKVTVENSQKLSKGFRKERGPKPKREWGMS